MADTELDTSCPLTHFQADDVSPPTLTLPPLLLHARPGLGHQPSPSPPKPLTACPLCNLKHNKVGVLTPSFYENAELSSGGLRFTTLTQALL